MHDPSSTEQTLRVPDESAVHLDSGSSTTTKGHTTASGDGHNALDKQRHYVAAPVDPSRVVAKPQPHGKESRREIEIKQIRRRFSPAETSTLDSTILAFKLHPTDPDFPFELDHLECILQVPSNYPESAPPTLNVRNKEMEKGFQINVEQGFDSIVKASPKSSLLAHINSLDKQLESLLSGNKANTIKLIANTSRTSDPPGLSIEGRKPSFEETRVPAPSKLVEPAYSLEQRSTAASRRDAETRQLEARLGRQPLFFKSSDGIAYTLPIDPRRRGDLPVPLQSIKSLRLFVPMLYPLLPCRIALQGVTRDAALSAERAFERRAKESPDVTLMGHINFLAINMHEFAAEEVEAEGPLETDSTWGFESLDLHDSESEIEDGKAETGAQSTDRAHLHIIPRPPEWNPRDAQESDSEFEFLDEEDVSSGEEVGTLAHAADSQPERGISINFPNIELQNVELLELTSLSLVVRCSRCKESLEADNLRHEATSPRQETCKKCASVLNLGMLLRSNNTVLWPC